MRIKKSPFAEKVQKISVNTTYKATLGNIAFVDSTKNPNIV